MFAVADVLVLRPLPYPEPDELVWIYTENGPYRFNFSVADFQALETEQTTFAAVAALETSSRTFVAGDLAERLTVWSVTPDFFEVLGVNPIAGRSASLEESRPGTPRTVLVTSGFATARLGARSETGAEVVGATVVLDDVAHEVIGVLPDRLGPLGSRTQVFVTQQFEPPTRRGPFYQIVIARLADGGDPAAAADELGAISRRLYPVWRDSYQDENATFRLTNLRELLQGDVGRLVTLLAGSVGLLLLLAAANSANLLVSRARARERELAVRVALGASGRRVSGHLLAESAMLAAAGAALGVALAWGVLEALPTVAGAYLPRLGEVRLDARALAFASALAVATGLLFGLASALSQSGRNPLDGLRLAASRTFSAAPSVQRSQGLLVAAQVAAAAPLLAGSVLLASSLSNLGLADPGFDPDGFFSARVSLAVGRHPDEPERRRFWWDLEERVGSLPGVVAVGVADSRPPAEAFNYNNYDLEDHPAPVGENQPVAAWVSADAGYLGTLGVRLLEGRLLTRDDELEGAPPVILVDERWARRHFPGESPVGRRLREGGATGGPWTSVVGVVSEVPYAGFGGETGGTVYAPWTSFAQPFLVVRTEGDPVPLAGRIRDELRRLDSSAPLTDVETGESLIESAFVQPRHVALMLSTFSTVAVLLAVVGLYGITAHSVQRRRAEVAVRIALGGSAPGVFGQVLRSSMWPALLGLVAGVVAAPAFTRLLSGLLFGIAPGDPRALASVAAALTAVSLAACAVPAWSAARVDPAAVLREE
jgi:putative ABC transport system permease protein